MDPQNHGDGSNDTGKVCTPEHDPEPDPAEEKADIHWVADIAIEANHNQFLGRSNGCWSAMTSAAKVPDTTQGHGKAEYRGKSCNPSPRRRMGTEAQRRRKQPEP